MEICVKLDNEEWYDHVPRLLETSLEVKVTKLWDKHTQTDRTVRSNNP